MNAAPKVRLLTGGDLEFGVAGSQLSAPRPRALFVLLALNAGRAVSRDRLCDFLWPYTNQSTARQRLRMALFQMRRGLSAYFRDRLRTSAEAIALEIEPDDVDALRFQELADRATPGAQAAAADLYGGDLVAQMPPISEIFDRMLDDRRDLFRSTFLAMLHDMMRTRAEAGDRAGFERAMRRALHIDRANSDTAALAMAAAAADGQARRVQEFYDLYAEAVRDSYGDDPPDAMRAARDAFITEAERQVADISGPPRRDAWTAGLTVLRARPRVALRLSARRLRIAAISVGILCIALIIAGGIIWSRSVRPDATGGEVFLLRPESLQAGACAPEHDPGSVEQALLDALRRFEGSNTIIGRMRHRLVGSGPGIFEVDLAVHCLDGQVRATVTVVDTATRGLVWVGRYDVDDAPVREFGARIHADLLPRIRP